MTDDELAEIERVWTAATRGPWRIEQTRDSGRVKLYSVNAPHLHDSYLLDLRDGDANEVANFEAIGKAAQHVAALLAEVKRLRG